MSNSMKGEIAMLYTGNTLREALGKALGTRDQYGRKIERRTSSIFQTKQFPPTNMTGPELQDFLRPYRAAAVQRAISDLSSRYNTDEPNEIGYAEWYNRNTGEHLIWGAGRAGRPCRKPDGGKHFCFRAPQARGWEILVLGHSHPPTSTHGLPGLTDTSDDDELSGGDGRLAEYGPMVLISPGRSHPEQVDGRNSYETFDNWPLSRN